MYIGRRNVEGGGRQQSFANTSFRAVRGRAWRDQRDLGLRRSAQYSSGTADQSTLNYFVTRRVSSARWNVDRTLGDRRADLPLGRRRHRCELRALEPIPIGGVTPEALDYLQVPGLQQGRSNRRSTTAVTGDLGGYGIKSPLASDSIQVAFGAE